jgi:3-oxoadipate enol-lactonase
VEPAPPSLPPGRTVELPGRGTTFVRELPGPPGAPVVALLHGWTVTADVTWFRTYAALGERYRVLAFDLRGHGQGIRSRSPFRLEDCADDVAALAALYDIPRLVPVGYSMGGPVAMLVWQRHRALVEGLVLCSTARAFSTSRQDRLSFLALAGLARASRVTPAQTRAWLGEQFLARRSRKYEDWALEQVMRNDWRAVLQAGAAIGRFSAREWIGTVDRPSAVIITMRDRVVSPRRQQRLLDSMPDAVGFHLDAEHDACVAASELFVPALLAATDAVTRAGGRDTEAAS